MTERKDVLPFLGSREGTFSSFIGRIKRLYSEMDTAYEKAADRYGFRCRGCAETCCEERFFHYTLAEHLYLRSGIRSLSPETACAILAKAEEVQRLYRFQDFQGGSGRVMCPLCSSSLCSLYEYRPMICRLHGIPHRMQKPGGADHKGPGCNTFYSRTTTADLSDPGFDRTGFYSGMAALEIELRRLVKFRGRYRKTVADMVVDILVDNG